MGLKELGRLVMSTVIKYFIFRGIVDDNRTYKNITVQKDEMETIIPPMFGNDMTYCEVITPENVHLNFSSQPGGRPDKLRYLFLQKFIIA